jgi:hypothetical protein
MGPLVVGGGGGGGIGDALAFQERDEVVEGGREGVVLLIRPRIQGLLEAEEPRLEDAPERAGRCGVDAAQVGEGLLERRRRRPRAPRAGVAQVGGLDLVAAAGIQFAVQDVLGDGAVVAAVGGADDEPPPRLGTDALGLHELGHGVHAAPNALGLEGPMDARRAVGRPALLVGLSYALDQVVTPLRRRAGRASRPGVVAAPRDREDVAEDLDGELLLVVADEGELHDCSLAKKAVALFKISRSMRSLRFSSRSRRTSRCSSWGEASAAGAAGAGANLRIQPRSELVHFVNSRHRSPT